MNKSELVTYIAEAAELTKETAERALAAVLEAVTTTLQKGEALALVGFGTFDTKKRAARQGRNPATGKEISIAAATVPYFKAGTKLKEAVNGKSDDKKK